MWHVLGCDPRVLIPSLTCLEISYSVPRWHEMLGASQVAITCTMVCLISSVACCVEEPMEPEDTLSEPHFLKWQNGSWEQLHTAEGDLAQ